MTPTKKIQFDKGLFNIGDILKISDPASKYLTIWREGIEPVKTENIGHWVVIRVTENSVEITPLNELYK